MIIIHDQYDHLIVFVEQKNYSKNYKNLLISLVYSGKLELIKELEVMNYGN